MDTSRIVFAIPIVAVGLAAWLHSIGYLAAERGKARFHLFFAGTLISMLAVVFSSTPFAFLLAWEAMGLSSAGLVAFEHRGKTARDAAWIYLLACHAGACALMLAGALLYRTDAVFAAFALAVVGFGLKIGFPPFHVWLPEAHPAAPAPASAVMSGAMIPLGFHGLVRFFGLPGASVAEGTLCGSILLALGVVGAVGGILFALPQKNLKKLLAFSSVENMGIVAVALGLADLAHVRDEAEGLSAIASLALAGAFAHVLNHAFLKGALFLSAGSILRSVGTLDLDRMGGLMKRMPRTGAIFALSAAALAGLPPLNGFLGELLIAAAAFRAIRSGEPALVAAGFVALVAIAAVGGLAAALYAKATGAAFLGEPRSAEAAAAREAPFSMRFAVTTLFVLSLAMIPGTMLVDRVIGGGAGAETLAGAVTAGAALVLLVGALAALRRFLCPRGNVKPVVPVWDCGYAEPTARMAWTGTAFTQPLVDLFDFALRPRRHLIPFRGDPAAPSDAAIAAETDDRALVGFWRPAFVFAARLFQRGHLLQSGSLHLYILVSLIATIALLVAAFAS